MKTSAGVRARSAPGPAQTRWRGDGRVDSGHACRRRPLTRIARRRAHVLRGASGRGYGSDAGGPLFREHKLTKTDSLASIAIRYGVTTRDIKRANGGVRGRHPPRACVSRIPRTSLAEGAPLPGGGGVSGAASHRHQTGRHDPGARQDARVLRQRDARNHPRPRRAAVREPSATAAGARLRGRRAGGQEDRADGQPRKPRQPSRRLHEPSASSSADRSTHEGGGSKYGSALSGGAMPATAFGRDRALVSPPKPLSGPPRRA